MHKEVEMNPEEYVPLGKTDIRISPIGLGIMQWGDVKETDQVNSYKDRDIHEAFRVSLEAGVNFFDTAEVYGSGRSESYLGRYLKELSNKVIIATKFMPYPWRLGKGELKTALVNSLKRLGLSQVDLYQMHWPFPFVPIATWMEAMADVVAEGLVRAVGVSNYSPKQTTLAYETLAKHNIPLASNQVRFSLLHRSPERSGLVELCRKLGVTIIAYSPLEKGMLTGKFSPQNLPTGRRAWMYNKSFLIRTEPVMQELREIGSAHGGLTPAKVALNWLVSKGAVPIPGARNKQQAEENAGGMAWHLSDEEVARLDTISNKIS
jgi:aryl-alcohol dehydrogenase-like predicted oxidoreductase